MTDRDQQLYSLRPRIPSIIEEQATTAAERFQNRTLRPILKLQHDLLMALFRHYLHKRKGGYYDLPTSRRRAYVAHCLQKDQRLRQLMCGTIIGHFTTEEWLAYVDQEAELRRRLITMLIERIWDGMGESSSAS
ncbi:MAG: glyoxalase [Bacteroidota bacterium]